MSFVKNLQTTYEVPFCATFSRPGGNLSAATHRASGGPGGKSVLLGLK